MHLPNNTDISMLRPVECVWRCLSDYTVLRHMEMVCSCTACFPKQKRCQVSAAFLCYAPQLSPWHAHSSIWVCSKAECGQILLVAFVVLGTKTCSIEGVITATVPNNFPTALFKRLNPDHLLSVNKVYIPSTSNTTKATIAPTGQFLLLPEKSLCKFPPVISYWK